MLMIFCFFFAFLFIYLFIYLFICKKSHKKTRTRNLLVLSVSTVNIPVCDPKPSNSSWRCKSCNTGHKYVYFLANVTEGSFFGHRFGALASKSAGGCVSVYQDEGTCHPVEHSDWFMFLIVFGQQWSAVAQRNKLHQALAPQTILQWDQFIVAFSWDLLTIRKI